MSATGPMTTTMVALHRLLPLRHRYSLPPREIVSKITSSSSGQNEAIFALFTHFVFGGVMGALYAAATPSPAKRWGWKGLTGGLLVWMANYLVALPLLRILRPAYRQPSNRNFLMIVSHLVWGLTVAGFLASVLKGDSKSHALFHRPLLPHRDSE
jgi:uncharacterized membrane protein YagU involved in acid resistance